jgi:hypothetical protein
VQSANELAQSADGHERVITEIRVKRPSFDELGDKGRVAVEHRYRILIRAPLRRIVVLFEELQDAGVAVDNLRWPGGGEDPGKPVRAAGAGDAKHTSRDLDDARYVLAIGGGQVVGEPTTTPGSRLASGGVRRFSCRRVHQPFVMTGAIRVQKRMRCR